MTVLPPRSHEFHVQEHPWLIRVGDELLNYRIEVHQAIPTRLKAAFSWNMNSWRIPKSCREDPKMRRIKKLLKVGPVFLQENKRRSGIAIRKRSCFSIFLGFKLLVPMQNALIMIPGRVVLRSCYLRDGSLVREFSYLLEGLLRYSLTIDVPLSTSYLCTYILTMCKVSLNKLSARGVMLKKE